MMLGLGYTASGCPGPYCITDSSGDQVDCSDWSNFFNLSCWFAAPLDVAGSVASSAAAGVTGSAGNAASGVASGLTSNIVGLGVIVGAVLVVIELVKR